MNPWLTLIYIWAAPAIAFALYVAAEWIRDVAHERWEAHVDEALEVAGDDFAAWEREVLS